MKTNVTGSVCVTNSMRRGAGHLPDVVRGERSVVFIVRTGRGGPSAACAEARAVFATADKSWDVKNTNENQTLRNPVCKKILCGGVLGIFQTSSGSEESSTHTY